MHLCPAPRSAPERRKIPGPLNLLLHLICKYGIDTARRTETRTTRMIRIHGLSHEQLAALMRLTEDNQSFESAKLAPHLSVIEGGRRGPAEAGLREDCGLAAELRVVGY